MANRWQNARPAFRPRSQTSPAYPLLQRGYMNGYSTLVATALCVLLGLPSASLAQGGYFGRNKVQYREFDFKVLKTDHFDIYYYPEEEQAAQMASRMAERWYTRLSQLLNHQLSSPPATHPLRERVALPPDQHRRGRDRGGHRRRHRGLQTTHRAAVCRSDRGERSRARPRAGARLPVRHHRDQRQLGLGRRAWRCRCGSSRGWRSTCRSVPIDPLTAMWMREATRREQLPDDRQARQSRSTSRIATARRSGPTSPASTATAPSATCCAPPPDARRPTTRRSSPSCRSIRRS